MLILSRKRNQSVLIGDDIEITVVGMEDGKVQLGIKAPKTMLILRKEIKTEVETANRTAAQDTADLSQISAFFADTAEWAGKRRNVEKKEENG